MKNKIIMQVQPCAPIRAAIGDLQTEIALKGYPPRYRTLTALFVQCVEAGIALYTAGPYDVPPVTADYTVGPKKINIVMPIKTRTDIAIIAVTVTRPQRDMVNILALWGLEAVAQYVHALPYYIAPPRPKTGRPRTKSRDLVS